MAILNISTKQLTGTARPRIRIVITLRDGGVPSSTGFVPQQQYSLVTDASGDASIDLTPSANYTPNSFYAVSIHGDGWVDEGQFEKGAGTENLRDIWQALRRSGSAGGGTPGSGTGVGLSDAVPRQTAAAGAAGTGTLASRDDHVHEDRGTGGNPNLSDATPAATATTGSAGTSPNASRGDHRHPDGFTELTDLTDFPDSLSGQDYQTLVPNDAGNALRFIDPVLKRVDIIGLSESSATVLSGHLVSASDQAASGGYETFYSQSDSNTSVKERSLTGFAIDDLTQTNPGRVRRDGVFRIPVSTAFPSGLPIGTPVYGIISGSSAWTVSTVLPARGAGVRIQRIGEVSKILTNAYQVEFAFETASIDYTSTAGPHELSNATPQQTAATGASGTGTSASRDDHVHPDRGAPRTLATQTPAQTAAAGAVGSSTRVAREDHVHQDRGTGGGGAAAAEATEAQARAATDDATANATRLTPRRGKDLIEGQLGSHEQDYYFTGITASAVPWNRANADNRGNIWITTDTSGAPTPANIVNGLNNLTPGTRTIVVSQSPWHKSGESYTAFPQSGPTTGDGDTMYIVIQTQPESRYLQVALTTNWTSIGTGNAQVWWATFTLTLVGGTPNVTDDVLTLRTQQPSDLPLALKPQDIVHPPWAEVADTGTPAQTAATGTRGTSDDAARADHRHADRGAPRVLATQTPAQTAAAGAVGTSTRVAREDHVHQDRGTGGGGTAAPEATEAEARAGTGSTNRLSGRRGLDLLRGQLGAHVNDVYYTFTDASWVGAPDLRSGLWITSDTSGAPTAANIVRPENVTAGTVTLVVAHIGSSLQGLYNLQGNDITLPNSGPAAAIGSTVYVNEVGDPAKFASIILSTAWTSIGSGNTRRWYAQGTLSLPGGTLPNLVGAQTYQFRTVAPSTLDVALPHTSIIDPRWLASSIQDPQNLVGDAVTTADGSTEIVTRTAMGLRRITRDNLLPTTRFRNLAPSLPIGEAPVAGEVRTYEAVDGSQLVDKPSKSPGFSGGNYGLTSADGYLYAVTTSGSTYTISCFDSSFNNVSTRDIPTVQHTRRLSTWGNRIVAYIGTSTPTIRFYNITTRSEETSERITVTIPSGGTANGMACWDGKVYIWWDFATGNGRLEAYDIATRTRSSSDDVAVGSVVSAFGSGSNWSPTMRMRSFVITDLGLLHFQNSRDEDPTGNSTTLGQILTIAMPGNRLGIPARSVRTELQFRIGADSVTGSNADTPIMEDMTLLDGIIWCQQRTPSLNSTVTGDVTKRAFPPQPGRTVQYTGTVWEETDGAAVGRGAPGTPGVVGSSSIHIWRRSSTTPATPTGGTASDSKLTTPPTGWSLTAPSGTDALYLSSVAVSGSTIGTYSAPVEITPQIAATSTFSLTSLYSSHVSINTANQYTALTGTNPILAAEKLYLLVWDADPVNAGLSLMWMPGDLWHSGETHTAGSSSTSEAGSDGRYTFLWRDPWLFAAPDANRRVLVASGNISADPSPFHIYEVNTQGPKGDKGDKGDPGSVNLSNAEPQAVSISGADDGDSSDASRANHVHELAAAAIARLLPAPTSQTADAGKVAVLNSTGAGYELGGKPLVAPATGLIYNQNITIDTTNAGRTVSLGSTAPVIVAGAFYELSINPADTAGRNILFHFSGDAFRTEIDALATGVTATANADNVFYIAQDGSADNFYFLARDSAYKPLIIVSNAADDPMPWKLRRLW